MVVALLFGCGGGGGGNASTSAAATAIANCVAGPRPDADAALSAVAAVPDTAQLRELTRLRPDPSVPGRWLALEKAGRIQVLDTLPTTPRTFLNLADRVVSEGEGGLLGFAFHPSYPAVPQLFVFYTARGTPLRSVLSRLVLNDATTPTQFTEQILLTVNQPSRNHHGGDIGVGPDGLLYAALGDGEPVAGQWLPATRTLAGTMLRIDVVGVAWPSPGYRIPVDNPFATNPRCPAGTGAASCPEVYAWGFRNPWRWSFDAATGAIWLADVGEADFEEVNRITAGSNYGWPCREGFAPFDPAAPCLGPPVDPLVSYPHSNGDASVTGGLVYRGSAIPALRGRYVFGDYVSGRVFALREAADGSYGIDTLVDTPLNISSFAVDASGELFVTNNTFSGPAIYALEPAVAGIASSVPERLADTGCLRADSLQQPVPAAVPFAVNASFWADGATKTRYLSLPAGERITIASNGDWEVPRGTVLLKQFQLGGRLIETRLLARHTDGSYAGYSYRWNEAGTEASLVTGGAVSTIAGVEWQYPTAGECDRCHTAVAGHSLGLTTAQLNRSVGGANQLTTLTTAGAFVTPPGDPAQLPVQTDPANAQATLAARARSYLDTNCAQCHQPGGPTPSGMDLRAGTALAATATCNVVPAGNNLGIANARLIAPGDPASSVVIARMARRDHLQMPPVGSSLVDVTGVTLVTSWITSLGGCN
jgi:uncharacterized repeat protein (TIGR03806 family)